jgi:hypothetical protein
MSKALPELATQITYLLPTSTVNRRFWAPGEEYNTGTYAPYDVVIRNARLAGPFTLDAHGFALGQHKTDITDWVANYAHDSDYAEQVCDVAAAMSGADFVIPMSGQIRTSGLTSATKCFTARRGPTARVMTGSFASRFGVRSRRRHRICRSRSAKAAAYAMTKGRIIPRSMSM